METEFSGPELRGEKRSIGSVLLLAITKTAETVQGGPPSPVPDDPIPFLVTIPSSQALSTLLGPSCLLFISDQMASLPQDFPMHREGGICGGHCVLRPP